MGKKHTTSIDPSLTDITSDEERREHIAKAAYLRAAARGFVGGDPMQDWLDAEKEMTDQAPPEPDEA